MGGTPARCPVVEGGSRLRRYLAACCMNFLGHLLVSGKDDLTIVGNFMADAVKGRDLSGYSPGLQKGIRMHRQIDMFTDAHPLTLVGRQRLRAHCGKYAGVALDIFYDHVIARRWQELAPVPLPAFAHAMYRMLQANADLMPERTRYMLGHMIRHDWLSSYATIPGIARALQGLSSRVPQGALLQGAEAILVEHLPEFEQECLQFLPALQEHLYQWNEQG